MTHTERQVKLLAYLRGCAQHGSIPRGMIPFAWNIWSQVRTAMRGCILVPNASPGGEQQILYSWDNGEHHLELEVFPSGAVEWFYRNRTTGKLWSLDTTDSYPCPPDAQERLRLFVEETP